MGKPRFQNRYCMNSFHLKCLFKILLVLLSIDLFGQKDTSLNDLDSAGSRTVKIVEDGISASYPYGVLSMPPLSEAAGVLYLKNSLVYIPDDPALGEFRSKFRNTLALMEEKTPSGFITRIDGAKTTKTISTEELIYKLVDHINIKVDQSAVLRARLLDNFIMDFDRHSNQWEWVSIDSGGKKIYYPVPVDRDQAFYLGTGALTKMVSGKTKLPQLQGFREKVKDINSFNIVEQGFDRLFLNELSEDEWSRQIDVFLNAMTDEVIEAALHRQPREIQDYSAGRIISTLKNKRQHFKDEMMKYYRFLSRSVAVTGTNQREEFLISKNGSGVVTITVTAIDSAGNLSTKLYERVFDPTVTRELKLFGLEGDDRFVLTCGQSGVDIKIIGGPGKDEFANEGDARKVFVYDVNFDQNTFTGDHRFRNKISADPQNNEYQRLGYRYNSLSRGLAIEYTIGGLFIGPQVKIMKYGFRKEPYSSNQVISVTRSIDVSSYHLKYYADFIHVFGKTDLVFRGDAFLPSSRTFFFGLGNNTVFDKTKPGRHKYYFNHYNLVNVSLMARNRFNSWSQISYGPVFQYFRMKRKPNEDKYVTTLFPHDDALTLAFTGKQFEGGQIGL